MAKSFLSESQKNRIYELATIDNFSQTKLANLYDVSQGTISRILKDKSYEQEIKKREDIIKYAATEGFKSAAEKNLIPSTTEVPLIQVNYTED